MNRKWALFVVPLALFVCWLAYLGWLVLGRPTQAPGFPLVVSRPQVLASAVDVIAELPDNSGKAKVVEVLYPDDSADLKLKPGDEIEVRYINECHPVSRVKGVPPPPDWDGSGRYLVPLATARPDAMGWYEVAPVPVSPGFAPGGLTLVFRIYRDSPEVRAQYARIRKPHE